MSIQPLLPFAARIMGIGGPEQYKQLRADFQIIQQELPKLEARDLLFANNDIQSQFLSIKRDIAQIPLDGLWDADKIRAIQTPVQSLIDLQATMERLRIGKDSEISMSVYQFDTRGHELFDTVVNPVVESYTKLKSVNATIRYSATREKMREIKDLIERSRLVIADLEDKNPNVMMEIGIAYTYDKPIILFCSEDSKIHIWKGNMPFDLQGREIIYYNKANRGELMHALSEAVIDTIYDVNTFNPSWERATKDCNIMSSSRIVLFQWGEVWSTEALDTSFYMTFKISMDKKFVRSLYPDFRVLLSTKPNKFPRVLCIFPWELADNDQRRAECHIDYQISEDVTAERITQIPAALVDNDHLEYKVVVAKFQDHLVFETTIFDESVSRINVNIADFEKYSYSLNEPQYIGFFTPNSEVTVSEISIKRLTIKSI